MSLQAFRSRRVVTPEGVREAAILVDGETIKNVIPFSEALAENCEVHDFGDAAILPGLVDPHVHINDPGGAEWEGFETGTRAAAAGGYTMLVDMRTIGAACSLFMARIAPMGMLFIPCRNGYSHRPDEYASPEDIVRGTLVLAETLATLSK